MVYYGSTIGMMSVSMIFGVGFSPYWRLAWIGWKCWVMWRLICVRFGLWPDLIWKHYGFQWKISLDLKLRFLVLKKKKNYTTTSCKIFLKIVKLLQLCGYRQFAELHNFLWRVWLFSFLQFFSIIFAFHRSKFPTENC